MYIVHDEILSVDEAARYWKTTNGGIYSRDVVLEQYFDEMESRFKGTSSLYNRRKRECLVPITNILLFRENDFESLNKMDIADSIVAEFIARDQVENDILTSYFAKT
jgi:hypothetical protein